MIYRLPVEQAKLFSYSRRDVNENHDNDVRIEFYHFPALCTRTKQFLVKYARREIQLQLHKPLFMWVVLGFLRRKKTIM